MTTKNGEKLTKSEEIVFRGNSCPDCSISPLLSGPEGGGSINYKCSNHRCQSQFNEMGPFGVERICDASPGPLPPLSEAEPRYPINPDLNHDTNELRMVLNKVGHYTTVEELQRLGVLPILVGVLSSLESRIENIEERMKSM